MDKLKSLADFNIGEMKFPETKIGETVTKSTDWLAHKGGRTAYSTERSAAHRNRAPTVQVDERGG